MQSRDGRYVTRQLLEGSLAQKFDSDDDGKHQERCAECCR
jgi:hypothetical protein